MVRSSLEVSIFHTKFDINDSTNSTNYVHVHAVKTWIHVEFQSDAFFSKPTGRAAFQMISSTTAASIPTRITNVENEAAVPITTDEQASLSVLNRGWHEPSSDDVMVYEWINN